MDTERAKMGEPKRKASLCMRDKEGEGVFQVCCMSERQRKAPQCTRAERAQRDRGNTTLTMNKQTKQCVYHTPMCKAQGALEQKSAHSAVVKSCV